MSKYNWSEEAEKSGGSVKLPDGRHTVKIKEIVFEGKNGPFVSKSYDKQMLVVFQDADEREVAQMFTLSVKAGWVLAKLLAACQPAIDLDRLAKDGIEPKHFGNPEFASNQLVGRSVLVDVTTESRDGKEYPRVSFIRPSHNISAPFSDEEIPF